MGAKTVLAEAALLCCMLVHGPAARAATLTTLHNFTYGQDGQYPSSGGLIWVHGSLLGTTTEGGTSGCGFGTCGTVFQVNPKTGREAVIYAFPGGAGGGRPLGGLLAVGGGFYGTTFEGGDFTNNACYGSGCGTVFRIDRATGASTVLYAFQGGSDGQWPSAGLAHAHGLLYGATEFGGPANLGTVFTIDPATGSHSVLHGFTGGRDGSGPAATLLAIGDTLYGTTGTGGTAGPSSCDCGTVFAIDAATGAETVVHRFKGGADGAFPSSSLVPAQGLRRLWDHGLYGTTAGGGIFGRGTAFRFDPRNGAWRVLYSFGSGNDGFSAGGALAWANGALYGTTNAGGAYSQGTIFRLDPDSGAEAVLFNFFYTVGSDPSGGLLAKDGVFYGTNSVGGANGFGTVFAFTP